ncbi:hypothetical protein [Olivibacter sitiensis]|uniref:hypothetical protein n=1 Tax=Olivibacter sitiensis TaxID=376470 RepID=UPI001B7FAF2E|nr:hypothetical protein [Olivibacter sitiensis]
MKKKLVKPEHQQSLKVIILNIALPAVIFIALMKLHVKAELLILPLLVLCYNGLFLLISWLALPFYGLRKNSAEIRTLMLLMPSLAPGLSCFPFISEYIGEEALARGALADVGNKIAVLIFSYMLAMHWFYKLNSHVKHSGHAKIKSLFIGMLNEPINVVMALAIVLLCCNVYFEDLPLFLQDAAKLLADLMTPLILLFIGIAVVFKWDEFKQIGTLLLFRAGMTFIVSGIFLLFIPGASHMAILLAVVFPQSSCSFWPLAHMAAVEVLSKKEGSSSSPKVFNMQLAMNVLALSLPFSTLMVLSIFTSGAFFTHIPNIFFVGIGLIILSAIPVVIKWYKRKSKYKAYKNGDLERKEQTFFPSEQFS